MIQLRSIVNVTDNTGASKVSVIQVLGRGNRKFGGLGDMINGMVKKADPHGVVKTHEIVKAVLVRTHKEKRRSDGSYIRFDDNAAVIIDPKSKDPKGTRIFGPIAREIRNAGFMKIISLAPEVL